MVSERQKTLEQINAYVDGELDVEARAAVNARAAEDPEFARELATVSRLKATVSESVPPVGLSVPAPRRPSRLKRALAALAASLVIAAGVGWHVLDRQGRTDADIALDWSIAIHRAWKPAKSNAPDEATVHTVSATLNPNIPDLTANGLDIAFVGARKLPNDQVRALVVGYEGSRGCRLTLIVRRTEGEPFADPLDIRSGPVQGYLWDAGRLRYALLAEGMALQRFELIAESVRRASVDRLPLDQRTRTALTRNRTASPPCRA